MKKYIEVVNGNEEKAKRSLIRKDAIIGVDDMGEKARIVIADQSERKSILYTPTSYDEIKAALASQADAEGVKEIIDDLVNEVTIGHTSIGLDGHWLIVSNGWTAMDFLRYFAKQLKERLDSGLNNENQES